MWPFKKPQSPVKHSSYVALFMLLGWLVVYNLFCFLEYLVLEMLVNDFERYGLGLSWSQWWTLHHLALVMFSLLGIWLGYRQGNFWWQEIYVKKHKAW